MHVFYYFINLNVLESVSDVFQVEEKFDFVINCAAETKLGQSEAVRITFKNMRNSIAGLYMWRRICRNSLGIFANLTLKMMSFSLC